jgi:hypothetical protein
MHFGMYLIHFLQGLIKMDRGSTKNLFSSPTINRADGCSRTERRVSEDRRQRAGFTKMLACSPAHRKLFFSKWAILPYFIKKVERELASFIYREPAEHPYNAPMWLWSTTILDTPPPMAEPHVSLCSQLTTQHFGKNLYI